MTTIRTPRFSVEIPADRGSRALTYRPPSGRALWVDPLVFDADGKGYTAAKVTVEEVREAEAFLGVAEHRVVARLDDAPEFRVECVLRVAEESPVLRFRYRLSCDRPARLTKRDGRDALRYLGVAWDEGPLSFKEVRFSEFNALFHSFMPSETPLESRYFRQQGKHLCMGPMLVGASPGFSALVAYEHGSQYPDAFLEYRLDTEFHAEPYFGLWAVKGNYADGQEIGPGAPPFESPWFQIAAVESDEEELARAYRTWVLKYQTPNAESRKPYVFYNTWNYQERVRHGQGKPYLAEMNEARMLAEIDVAHRMGIDVFVIDTGWYEKTGDWRVSSARFPSGLGPIKEKLDGYGMKLGLWFNPTVAAVSSEMRRRHEDCLMTHDGRPHDPRPVWETEESQGLCLVSRYGEAFADELIRLHREVGVTYFKWDAIGQYGCDAPGHGHGEAHNTPEERRQCYGFRLGEAMTRVVDRVCAACPEAIVDFDVTEGGRTVGLQFLSAGKYFLINNGPYAHEYQVAMPEGDAVPNPNLFFQPGPARAWICRAPLDYDRWIPSVLFLTHYLPDATHAAGWNRGRTVRGENPWIALASLVLGQNGIWGDLLALPEETVATFGEALSHYRQVRDDITAAYPVRTGQVGGSPEVHEKINAATGRGVVCLLASTPGAYTYVTRHAVAAAGTLWQTPGVSVTLDANGHARIEATFGPDQHAKLVFF